MILHHRLASAALAATLVVTGACQAPHPPPRRPPRPVLPEPAPAPVVVARPALTAEAVLGALEADRQARLDEALAIYAPDAVWREPGLDETKRQGVARMKEGRLALRKAFPDLAERASRVIAVEGAFVVESILTGTHKGDLGSLPATGRRIGVEGVTVLRHRDALVREVDHVANAATLLSQLGELPPAAGRRDIPGPPDKPPVVVRGAENPAGEAVARRFIAALAAPEADGMAAHLQPDAVIFEVATLRPFTGAEGRAEVHRVLATQLAEPSAEVLWVASAGAVVVAQVRHGGVWRAGDVPKRVSLHALYVFDVAASGLLSRVTRYANTLQWARAAGIDVPLRSRQADGGGD